MEVTVEWTRKAMAGGYGGVVAKIKARFGIGGISVNWRSTATVTEADIPHLMKTQEQGYIRVIGLPDGTARSG